MSNNTAHDKLALFIREHPFSLQQSNAESIPKTPAQKQFERDVYDFARDLRLSKKDAKKQVTSARPFRGKAERDNHDSAMNNQAPDEMTAAQNPLKSVSLNAAQSQHESAEWQEVLDQQNQPSPPQPHSNDSSRKRKLGPAAQEVDVAMPSKRKKKNSKQGASSGQHISKRAGDESSEVEHASRMDEQTKGGADLEDCDGKGSVRDSRDGDVGHEPGAEPLFASSTPLDTTEGSKGAPVRSASALSDVDRAKRKELKKQRRLGERLAQKPTRKDQQARERHVAPKTHNFGKAAPEAPGAVDSMEPRSQAEAHKNFVRSNERDPNEGGPSTKKSNKNKRKSKETTAALDAELRALNTYSNEQQIDDFDKGQLGDASNAVKNDIKNAKAEQEGMIEDEKAGKRKVEQSIQTAAEKKRRNDHTPEPSTEQSKPKRKKPKKKHKQEPSDFPHPNDSVRVAAADEGMPTTDKTNTTKKPPTTPTKSYLDIDIEFPWSDSPLSSCPSSPTPPSPLPTPPTLNTPKPPPPLKRRPSSKLSPYFPPPPRPPRPPTSCIPFPPLSSPRFGLLQELLAHTPFHLLLACIFLTKTRGSVALPLFYTLISRYPTPSALAAADLADVIAAFQNLGLQNQRGKRVVALSKAWVKDEPRRGRRWRRRGYPGDDGDIKACEEPIADEDEDIRIAWEIGHLPGVGRYALDSWRIFCRDRLRGVEGGMGEYVSPFCEGRGGDEERRADDDKRLPAEDQQPEPSGEWTRVVPTDKELRAYLRWRWLRHGWEWDAVTGERKRASGEVMREAEGGGVDIERG